MDKEKLEYEIDNLMKVLQKVDSIINFNMSGKFIVSHKKTIGVRQMIINSILRLQSQLPIKDTNDA